MSTETRTLCEKFMLRVELLNSGLLALNMIYLLRFLELAQVDKNSWHGHMIYGKTLLCGHLIERMLNLNDKSKQL